MLGFLFQLIAYQIIQVNQTLPCWENATAGANIWRNCGIEQDYIQTMLLPWEWITGGYFSLIIVSIFIGFTYIKYHKAIYPVLIGIIFLPFSYFVFPNTFWTFIAIFAGMVISALIWFIFTKQTKEY